MRSVREGRQQDLTSGVARATRTEVPMPQRSPSPGLKPVATLRLGPREVLRRFKLGRSTVFPPVDAQDQRGG